MNMKWTDPVAQSRWKLSLVVEEGPRPASRDEKTTRRRDFARGAELRLEFRKHMGLPMISNPWPEFSVDDQTLKRVFDWIDPMLRQGIAHFARGYLTEIAIPSTPEWFVFRPHRSDRSIERDEDGVECLNEYPAAVSNEFISHVVAHSLTGLKFVPLEEKSRFRQRRLWFRALPMHALGRGSDHPWVDRDLHVRQQAALSQRVGMEPERTIDRGIRHFHNDELRTVVPGISDALKRAISLFPPGELTIHGAVRLPRRQLRTMQPADFGFTPLFDRSYDLCISARASAKLIADGMMSAADIQPIVIVETEEAQIPALDAPIEVQAFPYLQQQLENRPAEVQVPAPLWDYEWTPEVALQAARRQLTASRRRQLINESELNAALRTIGLPLPEMWRQLLLVAGEFGEIGDCCVPSPQRWVEDWENYAELLNEAARFPDARYLYVGGTGSGDMYALELRGDRKDVAFDTPLLFFDHEISRFTARWQSITQFLESWLRR